MTFLSFPSSFLHTSNQSSVHSRQYTFLPYPFLYNNCILNMCDLIYFDTGDHDDLTNPNLYSDLEHSSFQRILPAPSPPPPPSLHAYLRRIPRSGKYMRFGRSSKSPLLQMIKRLQASTKQTSPKQHGQQQQGQQQQQQPFMLKTIVDMDLNRLAQYLLKE